MQMIASMVNNSSELLTNNLFAYVENNPVNKSDPDGHFSGVIAHVGERALIILFTAIAQLGRTAAINVLVSLLPSIAAVGVVVLVAVAIYAYYRTHKSQVNNWLAQSKKGADKSGETPEVKYPGNDPAKSPGKGWKWKGKGEQGSGQGNYTNPKTGESLHPDLGHSTEGKGIGPHGDYKSPEGKWYRIFPNGKIQPK